MSSSLAHFSLAFKLKCKTRSSWKSQTSSFWEDVWLFPPPLKKTANTKNDVNLTHRAVISPTENFVCTIMTGWWWSVQKGRGSYFCLAAAMYRPDFHPAAVRSGVWSGGGRSIRPGHCSRWRQILFISCHGEGERKWRGGGWRKGGWLLGW